MWSFKCVLARELDDPGFHRRPLPARRRSRRRLAPPPPHGHEVDARTAICVLTHDPKFDIPLLSPALGHPVAHVGAMRSRRTHEDRNQRLREAGVTAGRLSHLNSPIGLDLGARTPEETAISITAEIIAHTHHGTGRSLSNGTGPIHPASGRHAVTNCSGQEVRPASRATRAAWTRLVTSSAVRMRLT